MSKFKVGIDAGHGMNTPGKQTPNLEEDLYIDGKLVRKKGKSIEENEWNRGVSEYLAKSLERCGIDYIFLADKTGKVDTSLNNRIKKANSNKCDIVISNHYNAYGGCVDFVDRDGGLLVLRTNNANPKSIKLGELVAEQLEKDINYKYSYGLRRDIDISGFTLAILRQTNMPSILIEFGFMDVLREAKLMLDKDHQKKCGESVCKGICKYFDVPYINEGKKVVKMIKNIHNTPINIRNTPDWSSPSVSTLGVGDSVTYVETVTPKNGETKMYKTISGTYVTASAKYTELVEIKK